jgi:hypothetical protein
MSLTSWHNQFTYIYKTINITNYQDIRLALKKKKNSIKSQRSAFQFENFILYYLFFVNLNKIKIFVFP